MEQIKTISDWEVLTPTGWNNFAGIKRVEENRTLQITLSNGLCIEGALNHRILFENSKFIQLDELSIKQYLSYYDAEVIDIRINDCPVNLYDLLDVEGGNVYYTNGIVSHNCGLGNQFHKLYISAVEGKRIEGMDAFNPITLPWHLHPERDQIWRDLQTELLGPRLAAQECDGDFLTSGHTVIDGEIIKWYLERCSDPIEKRGLGMDYWLWKQPQYDRNYVVFADVARGDGNDNSSFQVVDVETLEQVAEFDGQLGTREFGNFLVAVATEWNNALLCVLNRNYGWEVVNQVIERGYPNLYYSYRHDPYLDPNIHIRKNVDLRDKSDKIPGFTETEPIRTTTVSKMETYLNEKSVKINSKRLVNQLLVFVWLNRKAQAAPGYKDDLVIAYMYHFYMHDIALKMRLMGIELTKKTLSTTHKSVYRPRITGIDPYKQRVGNTTESLTWLL